MTEYRLVTSWRMEAPLHAVYDAVFDSLRWPDWWRGAERVEQLAPGDADGIGNVRRYTWKSRLAYRLVFDARIMRIEPLALLEADATGDLEGVGRWLFSHEAGITTVRHEWHVKTTRRWMNGIAPVARALFERNHELMMQQGAQGLARLLDARLVDGGAAGPPGRDDASRGKPRCRAFAGRRWMAGVAGGICAAVSSTVVQGALWWASGAPLPAIFFRDARMAAAIVMGRSVLPPPATFDWLVMLAATVVHFALSIAYGLLLALLMPRLRLRPALLAGALFGLLLYAANMYGFTAVFPWFVASRDWITAVAHAAFGMTAAWVIGRWDRACAPVR